MDALSSTPLHLRRIAGGQLAALAASASAAVAASVAAPLATGHPLAALGRPEPQQPGVGSRLDAAA
jgi:hypothetical protein